MNFLTSSLLLFMFFLSAKGFVCTTEKPRDDVIGSWIKDANEVKTNM